MTGPRLLVAISFVVAAMCLALVVTADSAELAAHLVVRWTARTSLVCFGPIALGILAAIAVIRLFAWLRGVARARTRMAA